MYYNLSLKVLKQKINLILRLTQENSIEFQVQSVYLIYTGLIVHVTINLAYLKEQVLFIRSICSKHTV